MMVLSLRDLKDVTEARYHAQRSRIRAVLAEESRLRSALDSLSERTIGDRALLSNHRSMQALGADVMWQSWAANLRRTLNAELANVLARKITLMREVRTEFGRREAVNEMIRREASEKTRRRQSRFLNTLLDRASYPHQGDP